MPYRFAQARLKEAAVAPRHAHPGRFYCIRVSGRRVLICENRSSGNAAGPAALKRDLNRMRIHPMRRYIATTAALAMIAVGATALSACGHTTEQRAATGAIAGAVVAGPVGAAVGGAAGAARPD